MTITLTTLIKKSEELTNQKDQVQVTLNNLETVTKSIQIGQQITWMRTNQDSCLTGINKFCIPVETDGTWECIICFHRLTPPVDDPAGKWTIESKADFKKRIQGQLTGTKKEDK